MNNAKPDKSPRRMESKRILMPIVVSHAVLLLVGVVWGISLLVQKHYEPKIVFPVLSAKPVDVNSIVLAPIQGRSNAVNLASEPITIHDPVAIARICDALNKARPFSPNHPGALWRCALMLNTKAGSYKCVVASTGTSRNGVLVYFHSNGEWGWNVGEYRADELGPALEKIVRR